MLFITGFRSQSSTVVRMCVCVHMCVRVCSCFGHNIFLNQEFHIKVRFQFSLNNSDDLETLGPTDHNLLELGCGCPFQKMHNLQLATVPTHPHCFPSSVYLTHVCHILNLLTFLSPLLDLQKIKLSSIVLQFNSVRCLDQVQTF